MVCPQCQRPLPEGGAFCPTCLTLVNPPPVLLPIVSFCISLSQSVAQGHTSDDAFRQELAKLRTHLEAHRSRLQELDTEAVPLDIIRKVRDLLAQGYNSFEEAFNDLEAYLEGRQIDHLVRALEVMLKASMRFYEVDLIAEIARETIPAPVPCVKCGHMNPAGSRYCEHCNAGLLAAPVAARATTVTYREEEGMTVPKEWYSSHFLHLKETAQGYLAGTVSAQDYQAALTTMGNIIEKSETQYRTLSLPPETRSDPATVEGCRLIEEGIAQYREALAQLDSSLEDKNPETVSEGLRLAQEASDKLIKVILMARGGVRRPTEEPAAPPSRQDEGTMSEEAIRLTDTSESQP